MAEGISVRLTAVPVTGPNILVPDVKDVSDLAGYDLPGPLYVPVPGNVEIPYTSRIAISMEEGSIRELELAGEIIVEFILSTKFMDAVGGGAATVDYVPDEVPGGAIDGFNTNYTLAFSPTTFVGLYLNGQKIVSSGVDYFLTGTAITMVVAPTIGESLRADYIKGGPVVFAADETPAGVINGVNPTFTTAFLPLTFVGCFVNGLKQLRDPDGALPVAVGMDYVLVGSTITFGASSIPLGGDTIRVDYIR